MAMYSFFKSVIRVKRKEEFSFIQQVSDTSTLEKLFSFLSFLIIEPEANKKFVEKYEHILSLVPKEKEMECIKLYKKYEEFLTENKPPMIQREYTTDLLRQEIQKIIQTSFLSEPFQIYFLPENQKIFTLFRLTLFLVNQQIVAEIRPFMWENIFKHITQSTQFEGMEMIKGQLVTPAFTIQKISLMSEKELMLATNNFYESLYTETSTLVGKEQAEQFFLAVYQYIKVTFSFDVISLLLDMLPDEIVDEERIEIKSKRELEKIIQEKTSQLENAKKLLEQKVEEFQRQNQKLEDIKKSMLSLLEDIQEEKEKAEEEKARDDALLDSIGDGMMASDQHNRIVLMNEQGLSLLGYKKDELIGREMAEIVGLVYENGDAVPINKRPAYLALSSGEKVSLSATSMDTIYYVRKDKSRFPAIVTSTPVVVNKKIVGTITIYRDATKEKEIDRMKTEFISLASHQLRTPLSAIKWFGEMLLAGDAGKLTDEQNEFVKNISISTDRMIELVDSLLNISRIESGRIVVDPQVTNLKDLVESIITELGSKIQERHQNIILTVTEDLPTIKIDQRLIRQVYLNLLTNSVKYSPIGSEVSIALSKQGDQILSKIEDHGYGIPKEQQAKIFEKFFRAENAIKVETDGTGLGLYLVKAIIESSHGKIWFESEESKGTTFCFTLPVSGMAAKDGVVTLE